MNVEQPSGECTFCGREMTRGGMSRHLLACVERKERIREADQKSGGEETLYHLRVQNARGGTYWLHLEMRGAATLRDLDSYLRAIWLECCGHLSQFSFGGWRGRPIPMTMEIEQVLAPEEELVHIYDFGTSSKTLIKVVSERMGKPLTENPIFLMARNCPPELECAECGRPAEWICFECLYEPGRGGLLCGKHAEEDQHTEYGEPVKLVNSPRTGLCGYAGPAEPPY